MRELLKNNGAERYSFDPAERSESEELEKNSHLEKRPKRDDEGIDQKLERLKKETITELGARDTIVPYCKPHHRL